MILYGHTSVIADHVDATLLDDPGRKIPVGREAKIRLLHLFLVYNEFSAAKLNFFSFCCYDTLEKHDPVSCKTYSHHIESLRSRKEIGEPPAKIETPVPIGRLHTDPFDMKRDTKVSKKDRREEGDQQSPHEKFPS
jgi:hypothetical protein